MLVQTFFAPAPAIQQYKNLHLDQKEMYATKPKTFSFHSSKIEGPNQQSLSFEKTNVWCSACLSTKKCLLACFSSFT